MALSIRSVHLYHRWYGNERTSQPPDRRKSYYPFQCQAPCISRSARRNSVTTASSGSSVLPEDRLAQIGLDRTFPRLEDTSTTPPPMLTASTVPMPLVTTSTVPSDSTGTIEVDLVRFSSLTLSSEFRHFTDFVLRDLTRALTVGVGFHSSCSDSCSEPVN